MIALTIAGFDPSGGAGVLADVKTFHSLGIYGTAAITALTAQNVKKVASIEPVSPEFIEKQIDLIMDQHPAVYGKTGMLYTPEAVEIVVDKIKEYELKIVVDPVLVSGSGFSLSQEDLTTSIRKKLLPNAYLTTPNLEEAQKISGITIKNQDDAIKAAQDIGKICPVVVTGGHLDGDDIFYDGETELIKGQLVSSENTHGSGCTYAAAVTAYLIRGLELEKAVREASKYVKNAIKNGNYGTLNQFWKH
jgi:hydroxymethylpyrimidine/phosphomethylpyrimidine kinase